VRLILIALCLPALLGGCVARTAYHVATLPVRAGSQVVDWSTTSRDEADRNRGRRMRKEEARERKAERKAAREQAREGR
jgi:hypothetical protein